MRDYWDELEALPWDEVRQWQARRLGPWLETLPKRSEFHRDLLAGVTLPDSPPDLKALADLPMTRKDDVRRSQAESAPGRPFGRHQAAPLEDIVQIVSSSGTTGDPTLFALTAKDLSMWQQAVAAALYTAGVRRHDVAAHLVGLPSVAGGMPYADGFRTIGATLAWLGGLPPERIVRALPRIQATVVLTTSSFGTYLTEKCEELVGRSARSLGLKNMLGGGEPGLAQPEIRQRIKDGWGLEHVHEVMGLGDVLPMVWAECDDEGGMHFTAQRSVVVELIDPDTGEQLPWEEGVRGEAVYTTLDREATPALRYRSADHLVVTAMACPCGRTSPRIRCIGRTDDMLIYKAMNVFPSAIRDVVLEGFAERAQPYVRIWKRYPEQVRFDHPIPVDVEASPSLPRDQYESTAAMIEHRIRQRLQVRVKVTVAEPGALPRSTYKTPLVHVREP